MISVINPLAVIFIIVCILCMTVSIRKHVLELPIIYSSIIICKNTVAVPFAIFVLRITDSSIRINYCNEAIHHAMCELSPLVCISHLLLCDSMQLTSIPFTNILRQSFCQYSHSLPLTFRINIASVFFSAVIFSINICKSVLDGFKFRLEQPLKLFAICKVKNGIWENLEAIVNLHNSIAFCNHNFFKTLMSRCGCLVVSSM